MRMPEPQLQPKCACGGSCSSCKGEAPEEQPTGLQLKRVNGSVPGLREAPSQVHDVLRSPGQPLDASTRAFMEPRFGHDFSRVRVHANPAGEQSAKQINAHAYTLGSNIVFGAGQYAPGTTDGRRLLAHELTHVLQQTGDGLWSKGEDNRIQRDALEPPSGDMSDEEVEDNPQFTIQRRAIGSDTGGLTAPGVPLTTGGSPLPDGTRQYFERRFGRDFSDVRVHMGSPADDANRGLNSHAFTYGNHIWAGARSGSGAGTAAGARAYARGAADAAVSACDRDAAGEDLGPGAKNIAPARYAAQSGKGRFVETEMHGRQKAGFSQRESG